MTQKLTLPIQVGKKYVRRDGKVIEITRIKFNRKAWYNQA